MDITSIYADSRRKMYLAVRAAGLLSLGMGLPLLGGPVTWFISLLRVAWPPAPGSGESFASVFLGVLGSSQFQTYLVGVSGPGVFACLLGVYLLRCRPYRLLSRIRA